jgi:hypothetical protein
LIFTHPWFQIPDPEVKKALEIDLIFEILIATSKVKTTNLYFLFFILDSGWKKSGSGINILDPQHW